MAIGKEKAESIQLVLTCGRCGRKSIVNQKELWKMNRCPDFGDHVPVSRELFSFERGLCFNEAKFREESLLCLSCYDKYINFRDRLLKAVNKRLLAFLEDEAL